MIVGLSILTQSPMEMQRSMMSGVVIVPYLLLALGAIVLSTGLYVLASKMMVHGSTIGVLMLVYGVIMLVLGVGMIGQLFNLMMQGSAVSGTTMILLGLAMLYSGFDMTRKPMKTRMTWARTSKIRASTEF